MLTEDPKRTTRTKTIGSRWLNSSTNSWVFISIQFGHELQSNCHIPLFTFYTHYNADLMFLCLYIVTLIFIMKWCIWLLNLKREFMFIYLQILHHTVWETIVWPAHFFHYHCTFIYSTSYPSFRCTMFTLVC